MHAPQYVVIWGYGIILFADVPLLFTHAADVTCPHMSFMAIILHPLQNEWAFSIHDSVTSPPDV